MKEDDDHIIPAPIIRIVSEDPVSTTDALYSSPISNSSESVEAQPPLNPQFQASQPGEPRKKDSVSTGTFGNLIRQVNKEPPVNDRVESARQRIRFNLKKVGPRPKKGDQCEAWRKYLF